jgi:hypothetical protein
MKSRLSDYFSKASEGTKSALSAHFIKRKEQKKESNRCSGEDDCPSWRNLRSHGWFNSQNFVLAGNELARYICTTVLHRFHLQESSDDDQIVKELDKID